MNINTPNVSILPADGEAASAATIQRFDEVLAAVERSGAVTKTRREFETSRKRHAVLRSAQNALNRHSKELFDRVIAARREVEDGLLAQFTGEGPEVQARGLIQALLLEQAESSAVCSVLERTVEHLIPCANITQLETESRLLFARAVEVMRIADERFEKTAELLRGATEYESGIAIDIRSTFSGSLLSYAEQLKLQSVNRAREAEEQKRQYGRFTEADNQLRAQ